MRTKRSTLVILLAIISASLLVAGTTLAGNALSRPVGVVRITIPANTRQYVTVPFDVPSNSVDQALTADVGDQDTLHTWDPVLQQYVQARHIEGRWQREAEISGVTAHSGDGLVLHNQQAAPKTVYLAGEVVLDDEREMVLVPGLNLFGYPYSTGIRFDQTDLAVLKGANPDDAVLGGAGEPAGDTLDMGKAYWYQHKGADRLVWTEVRPYEDIFPRNDLPPRIEAIRVTDSRDGVTLDIVCSGTDGELLDVFYQDVTDQPFASRDGWRLAATLESAGQTRVQWQDQAAENREPLTVVPGRYYLVGRADIDFDADGVPDVRQVLLSRTLSMEALQAALQQQAGTGDGTTGGTGATGTVDDALGGTNIVIDVSEQMVRGRIIYVDAWQGSDVLSGRARMKIGQEGPKRTIRAGLAEAQAGETIVIEAGAYAEDLNIAGRDVSVRISGNVDLRGRSGVTPEPIYEETRQVLEQALGMEPTTNRLTEVQNETPGQ